MRLRCPGHSGDASVRVVGVYKFRNCPTPGLWDFSLSVPVGSGFPGPVEIDHELVCSSRDIVDSRRSALAAASEILLAKEAGPIVMDTSPRRSARCSWVGRIPGRRSTQEVTLYKSLGHIVQDLAAVTYPHSRASAAFGTS